MVLEIPREQERRTIKKKIEEETRRRKERIEE